MKRLPRGGGGSAHCAGLGKLVLARVPFEYLRRNGMRRADVHIIGAGPLCALYQRALGLHDVARVVHSQDATVKGLARIFGDMA